MSKTGRAAVFNGPGKPMTLNEYRIPEPAPGAIVLRMTAANVCGTDLHQWRGEFDITAIGRPYPQILGHEMTGEVYRLGDGVKFDTAGQDLSVGDRVVFRYLYSCGTCRACMIGLTRACPHSRDYLKTSCDSYPHFYGAFADFHYLRPNATVFRVPDGLEDTTVAGVNCALSQVVAGLQLVEAGLGDSIVIQGSGGLGVYACAVAKELGVSRVIAIDAHERRLQLAKAFGADATINLADMPLGSDRVDRVRELTNGWGADIVAELVGSPDVIGEGIAMLGRGGRYLEIGNVNAGMSCSFDPSSLVFRNATFYSMIYYEPRHLKQAIDLMDATRDKYPWSDIVSDVFSLEQIEEAFRASDRGEVTRAAIVP